MSIPLRLKFTFLFLIFVSIWSLFQINQITQIHSTEIIEEEPSPQINLDKVLVTFKACNGFANQRISIVYGILIAINLRKPLVLPRLPLDGTQKTGDFNIDSSYGSSEKFSLVFDLNQLQNFLSAFNLEVWEVDDFPGIKFLEANCPGMDMYSCVEHVKKQNTDASKFYGGIDFGCAFPSSIIGKELVLQQAGLVKGLLENLVPISKYQEMVLQMQSSIQKDSKDKRYNLVHLRVEQDWVDHCKRWSSIPDGIVRDNCMNNTETLGHQLQLKSVKSSLPLYIATQTSQANPYTLQRVQQNLQYNGYSKIFLKEDIITSLKTVQIPREIAALIDYFLALESNKFIGNSVSSFSAMALLERQFREKWAAYYNGGNVPMASFLPLYKIPWIIYSRCDSEKFFNEFLFIGLQSIYYYGNVEPYLFCVGDVNNTVLEQLKYVKVNIILRQRVVNYIRNPEQFVNIMYFNGLLMLDEFSKYNFVVFSGPKIFARKRITLDSFFMPLPQTVAMYNSLDRKFSGLMISNVEFIRSGFLNSGLEFFENLVASKNLQSRMDNNLLQNIEYLDQYPDPSLITFNKISIMDLENFLEYGNCPQNLGFPCDHVLELSCKYLQEILVFSYEPHKYTFLLKFCNIKLQT